MFGLLFGGLVVDVDDGGDNVLGVLFWLGGDVVKESLMGLSGLKIILLLFEVDFDFKGVLWKMFGDEACEKARP